MHSPNKLPDPWLFDSQALLRELDRCREMVLLIPTPTHASYFAANIAINALWNLREQLQYLIGLHAAMQRDWQARLAATVVPGPDEQRCAERHLAAFTPVIARLWRRAVRDHTSQKDRGGGGPVCQRLHEKISRATTGGTQRRAFCALLATVPQAS